MNFSVYEAAFAAKLGEGAIAFAFWKGRAASTFQIRDCRFQIEGPAIGNQNPRFIIMNPRSYTVPRPAVKHPLAFAPVRR